MQIKDKKNGSVLSTATNVPKFSLRKTIVAVAESMKLEGYDGNPDVKTKMEVKKVLSAR
jgi:hypothetical protein